MESAGVNFKASAESRYLRHQLKTYFSKNIDSKYSMHRGSVKLCYMYYYTV